jgi:hypothetical protein
MSAIIICSLINDRARAVGGYSHGPKPPKPPKDPIGPWIIVAICSLMTIISICLAIYYQTH